MQQIKKQKNENAKFMCDEIEYIIKNFGKRNAGGDGERKASEYMAEQLKGYADEVFMEDFKVNPKSFYGWISISVTLMLAAIVGYFFLPIVSLIFLAVAVTIMVGQFVLYRQLIDKLFPEKTSCNVTAVLKPKGEVKRRVFLNGHSDAANEWTINHKFGGKVMAMQVLITFLGVAYFCIITVISLISNGIGFNIAQSVSLYLGLGGLIFAPLFISMYFLSNEKLTVDGANDNLTGCYMGIAILKAMKENNIKLENTEVGVIVTGSEEVGLRGAKAWARDHANDYNDATTVIISYDTIREEKFLSVNKLDLNSICKSDIGVGELFKKAADNVGAVCNFGTVPVGSTDSAAFTQGGFRSVGITAMDHALKDYYHTRRDTYDNLDAKCLATTFEVTAEFIELFDKGIIDNK